MTNCMKLCTMVLALVVECGLATNANAQLRIVDYNTADIPNALAMTTVLDSMNNEVVDGVAKPIDAIILQELSSGDIAMMTSILNGFGVGTYVATNVGSTTGAGGVGLIYRTQTIDLVAQSQVVNTSPSGAARGVMRFTLRPDGYDDAADAANLYIYTTATINPATLVPTLPVAMSRRPPSEPTPMRWVTVPTSFTPVTSISIAPPNPCGRH